MMREYQLTLQLPIFLRLSRLPMENTENIYILVNKNM